MQAWLMAGAPDSMLSAAKHGQQLRRKALASGLSVGFRFQAYCLRDAPWASDEPINGSQTACSMAPILKG